MGIAGNGGALVPWVGAFLQAQAFYTHFLAASHKLGSSSVRAVTPQNATPQLLITTRHRSTGGLSTRARCFEKMYLHQRIPSSPRNGRISDPGFPHSPDVKETQVKRFILLKLSALVFGIGAVLVLTPACKAQSEV